MKKILLGFLALVIIAAVFSLMTGEVFACELEAVNKTENNIHGRCSNNPNIVVVCIQAKDAKGETKWRCHPLGRAHEQVESADLESAVDLVCGCK